MATEEGVVIKIDSATAWVKTTRSGACETCASRGSCSTVESGKEMEIEALNIAGARVDDCVVVSFDSASLLKISFLLYIFPILCLIAGAVFGQRISPFLGFNEPVPSVLFGLFFFLFAFAFIKFREKKLAAKDVYRPKIIRILKHA